MNFRGKSLKIKIYHFQGSPGPKKRMAYKNEKRMLDALEAFARLCKTLYRRKLRTKSGSKEFVGTLFQTSSTCRKERRGTDDI